jgi:hypothetical protein
MHEASHRHGLGCRHKAWDGFGDVMGEFLPHHHTVMLWAAVQGGMCLATVKRVDRGLFGSHGGQMGWNDS